jgi:hypothetical protein
VTAETQVYEIGAGPRALRDIPELARLLAQIEDSEPPIRQRHVRLETRSPERVKLSEELAVLNRPLADEIEYYDEVPRWRGSRVLVVLLVLAALGCAGYLLFGPRHGGDDNAAAGAPVVPPAVPAIAPVPARAPAAPLPQPPPIEARPAAKAAPRTPPEPVEAEPEGDPPLPPRHRGR